MDDPSQQQTVSGPGAIAVQVVGDNPYVQITLGGAPLLIQRIHKLKTQPTEILELLRVDVRATNLVGRTEDLAALAQWRDGPATVAVRCITGQAGAGKTRLAVEACERAEAAGWDAGFVSGEELHRFHHTQNLANWRPAKHSLLVIDYAASSLTVLRKWLDLLAPNRQAGAGPKLRILLLERQADSDGGWWAELSRRESNNHADAADLLRDETPVALLSPSNIQDRRALLTEAMALAAPLLEPRVAPAPEPPAAGTIAWFDARLASTRIENGPLYLLMAGAHAVHHGAPAALALGASDLAAQMADLERARLKKFARRRGFQDDGALITHLAACVTLQNGCPREAVADLVVEEMREMGLTAPGGPEAVSRALFDCLALAGAKLDAIRPDLVGEIFAIKTIEDPPHRRPAVALDAVLRAHRRDPGGVVDALIRGACDHALGRGDHIAIRWLDAVAAASTDPRTLIEIAGRLPDQTLALREFAAKVIERAIAELRCGGDRAESRTLLGGLITNLGIRLSDLGRREAALTAAEEAVTIWRTLTAERPEALTPDLAIALSNLAGRLSELGWREAALKAATEAVTLQRALAAERPDAVMPDLAISLNNLAGFLSDVGQREAALIAAEEAVTIRRTLTSERPEAFTPYLATSLSNLSNFLGDLGQRAAALDAAKEAVTLRRALAAERPDAFTPDLAGSLNNLGNFLSDLGQLDAAFDAANEAVALWRVLAAERPEAFNPDLATSINNLANRLGDLDRREAALKAAKEAVTLRRALAAERPEAFNPDLAMSLNNLANRLGDFGRHKAALKAAKEAVKLRRALAAERPDAFTSALATSVSNLTGCLISLDRRGAALDAGKEAVTLRRALAAERPDAFASDLASSLGMLGAAFEADGRISEALECAGDAIATLDPYFLEHPPAHARSMLALVRDYLRRSEAAGVDPDLDLLDPIIGPLSALSGGPEETS